MCLQLPVELLTLIGSLAGDLSVFLAYRQLNKHFCCVATPHVFASLNIHPSIARARTLVQMLSSQSHILHFVKHLRLEWSIRMWVERELFLEAGSEGYGDVGTRFILDPVIVSAFNSIWPLLSNLDLRSASLTFAGGHDMEESQAFLLQAVLYIRPHNLRSLHLINFSSGDPFLGEWVKDVRCIIRDIQKLHIVVSRHDPCQIGAFWDAPSGADFFGALHSLTHLSIVSVVPKYYGSALETSFPRLSSLELSGFLFAPTIKSNMESFLCLHADTLTSLSLTNPAV
ncbi:hypothetical protein BDZ89DRAFT_1055549, partial [Hymenopellis radicata]